MLAPNFSLSARVRPFARLGVALFLIAVVLGGASPALAQSAPFCAPGEVPTFRFGFAQLKQQLGPTMGQPIECEHKDVASGDTVQHTTTGLAYYREATNSPSFTDGFHHWALTPAGLVAWEGPSPDPPGTATRQPTRPTTGQPTTPSQPGPPGQELATPTASGWATVVEIDGPESFTARGAGGGTFRVWHIGIIGPTSSQGDWQARGASQHGQILRPGTRVWLEKLPTLDNPEARLTLRHVFTEGNPTEPVGAQLLRAGGVWVYPHAFHDYIQTFADRQAEAVSTRSGAWADTRSSAIFRPRGSAYGGFPIDPRALPILQALDKDELGNLLLLRINLFPVEIGVSRLPAGTAGAFLPRFYSIQIAESLVDAPPETVAGVLIHELTHTRQMIDKVIDGTDLGCYGQEIEAFEVSARYWQAIYGPQGKRPSVHPLDDELNMVLQQYLTEQIESRVRRSYVHQCSGR